MLKPKFPMALLLASSLAAVAQQSSKQDPYQGVSRPPDDDKIVVTTDDEPQPSKPAKPAAGTPLQTRPAAQTSKPVPVHPSTTSGTHPAGDDDIVSLPPAATVANATSSSPDTATLHPRLAAPQNPDADIVQLRPLGPGELRAGTPIRVALQTPLSTDETVRGQQFASRVTQDVTEEGQVLIPVGSEIRGRVTEVHAGSHFGAKATIHLRPDVVVLPDGSRYQLHAQVTDTQGSDTRANSEGSITPKSHAKRDATEYAMFAGSGALIGAKFGGGPGALIGTLVGAGIVTTHVLMNHPHASLPKDAEIVFSLTENTQLVPVQN